MSQELPLLSLPISTQYQSSFCLTIFSTSLSSKSSNSSPNYSPNQAFPISILFTSSLFYCFRIPTSNQFFFKPLSISSSLHLNPLHPPCPTSSRSRPHSATTLLCLLNTDHDFPFEDHSIYRPQCLPGTTPTWEDLHVITQTLEDIPRTIPTLEDLTATAPIPEEIVRHLGICRVSAATRSSMPRLLTQDRLQPRRHEQLHLHRPNHPSEQLYLPRPNHPCYTSLPKPRKQIQSNFSPSQSTRPAFCTQCKRYTTW